MLTALFRQILIKVLKNIETQNRIQDDLNDYCCLLGLDHLNFNIIQFLACILTRLFSLADAAKEQMIASNVVGESLSFLKTCNDKITMAVMNALCDLIRDGNFILFS